MAVGMDGSVWETWIDEKQKPSGEGYTDQQLYDWSLLVAPGQGARQSRSSPQFSGGSEGRSLFYNCFKVSTKLRRYQPHCPRYFLF